MGIALFCSLLALAGQYERKFMHEEREALEDVLR